MTATLDLRPALTAVVRQRLEAFREGFRHNLAILGPAGSGKSHLIRQALLGVDDGGIVPVTCSLQRMSSQEFTTHLASAVLRGVLKPEFDMPLEQLVDRAQPLVPKTVDAVNHLRRLTASQVQSEAFIHALDLIPMMAREIGRPCVLVLDEFLHIGDLGISQAFHELGKRVVTWPSVMFLMSSSSSPRAREILRERLQLLFGQFELLTVGSVDGEAAGGWIRRQFPGLPEDAPVVQFLLHWVGASAWHVRLLVQRMRERAALAGPETIDETVLVDAAWDLLGSQDGVLFQWYSALMERMADARHGPVAREALVAIACGARTTQAVAQRCPRRYLSQALQLLVQEDLAHRKGSCWVLPDQLLAGWLAWVFEPARSRGLLAKRDASGGFRRALHSVWESWRQATSQSLAERIGLLFGQFHNETVSLDQKTGRLPSFRRMSVQPESPTKTYILADGEEQRWCCLVHEGTLEESGVTAFERFCQTQSPRPSRKVVIAGEGLEANARLLAKEANMWVWGPDDLRVLSLLYGLLPGAIQ